MKNKVTLMLLLIASLGIMSSCKKDDDKSRKDIITGSTCWKLVKYEEKDGSGNYVDRTSEDYAACELDDCMRFNADGTYVITDSGVKCDPNITVIEEGTWSLINNDSEILVTTSGISLVNKIESIDENTIVTTVSFFGIEGRLTYKN